MSRRSRIPALVVTLLCLQGAPAFGEAKRLKVAALELTAERGLDTGLLRLLDEIMLSELSNRFDVVGKSDIASMLGFEQQKQMLGCAEDSSCLAEIGGALGVDLILSGSVGPLGKLYMVNLKLLDAAKARVVKRVTEPVSGSEEELVSGLQRAVKKLTEGVDVAPTVPAKPPEPLKNPPPAPPPAIAPATAPVPVEPAVIAPAPTPAEGSNTLRWAGVGLGGAALATGLVFGVLASNAAEAVTKNLESPDAAGAYVAEDAKLRARYARNVWLANGLVGAGLVVGVASFLVLGDAAPAGSGGGLAIGPAGVAWAGVLP